VPDGILRMVLAGGGTGGHVYPAIAMSEIARGRFGSVELLFIGVRGRAEEHVVPAAGIPIRYVSSRGLTGGIARLPAFGLSLARGTTQALSAIRGFDPHVVLATGGFSAAPTVLASALSRAVRRRPRILVHEQNAIPGRANALAGRFADVVLTTFESSCRFFSAAKVVHAGYPVRRPIGEVDREAARRALDLPGGAFVILAFGGSGGARSLNRAVAGALPDLLARTHVHVIHGTGRYFGSDYDPAGETARIVAGHGLETEMLDRYHPCGYIENMAEAYAASDLVICRAGAGTLFEIRRAELPAVLVPKRGLPHEHQLANARDFADGGAALLVEELAGQDGDHVPAEVLSRRVGSLIDDPTALGEIRRALLRRPIPDTDRVVGDVLASLV
jgi:UDP-N-acetylglucosamine--N-acetylmuramyl-(pentapeptide) pyrophosphoryl-undecaprenol N-acetylglucosamine transferase